MKTKAKLYLELIRFYRPIGTIVLLLALFWGIFAASSINNSFPPISIILIFALGAFVTRSAGCIINDIFDAEFDRKVERTKNRPLAAQTLTKLEALFLLFVLLMIALILLSFLSLNTLLLGVFLIIPITLYPLMKRVTFFPQIFLGLTKNAGILMVFMELRQEVALPGLLIYLAAALWNFTFDTIYAYADYKDDQNIGVKSTALYFGISIKKYLYIFYSLVVALLAFAGYLLGLPSIFYLTLVVALYLFFGIIRNFDPEDSKNCIKSFENNKYPGLMILIGFMTYLV